MIFCIFSGKLISVSNYLLEIVLVLPIINEKGIHIRYFFQEKMIENVNGR